MLCYIPDNSHYGSHERPRLMATRQRPSWFFRWGFLAVALFGIASFLGVNYVRQQLSEAPELRTVKIQRRDLRITVNTTGTVEPEEIVEVGADITGRIIRFGNDPENPEEPIQVGSLVSEGTVLVQLDDANLRIELEKASAARRLAEAEVAGLEIQFQQAKRTLERAQRLRNTNSQSEFDRIATAHDLAGSELATGKARLQQAVAQEQQAKLNLSRATIRAPIDGVVVDRRANVGQSVSPGVGLFLLTESLDTMRVRASVSESDIGKVEIGQPVTFSVDAYRDTKLHGKVEQVLVNARTHGNFVTYDVIVEIAKPEVTLFPSMTADVEFIVQERKNAWLVPNAALQWEPEPSPKPEVEKNGDSQQPEVVWTRSLDGKVHPISVQVGIDDGVQTQVIGDAFREGMPIVVGVVKKTTLARIIPSAKTMR